MMKYLLYMVLLAALISSCADEQPLKLTPDIFELKDSTTTGINFTNQLSYSREFNVYKYRNFYNGGGVALGDINNDGLVDIYFTANQLPNRLYLNKGDWQFEDITEAAGVAGTKAWSTGTTMVDINADGLLDIYVCNSGDVKGDNKENELFINQGDETFVESAADYGLNDEGFSTHASFFDYDKDGDLDVYILNNSFQAIGSFNLKKNERPVRDKLGGDKLLQNVDGKFVDVSEAAGIYGSVIGFGLGVTVGDVNNDQWEDIFVSNDFFERDYLYINNQDGTFTEELVESMPSISGASMGADIGDIDNDGYNDIFVTEMLPSEYERLKSVTTFESWDRYQYSVNNGYHHQFTRNTLHHNNGNGTFSEVSRYAGVPASDWSWGALFFDMDNDGLKDLYIANGIYKDLTDQDYLQYIANESVLRSVVADDGVNYKELIDIIPSNMVKNHAYKNRGSLQFEEYTSSGLQDPSFSNGSAYGDLDNDGDLDLVVNNVNMPSFIYENRATEQSGSRYLQVELQGEGSNRNAIGATVIVTAGEQQWKVEQQPARGFQSSMDIRLHVGVGDAEVVDLKVVWPSLKVSRMKAIATNQKLVLRESEASENFEQPIDEQQQLTALSDQLDHTHVENRYVDFNRERLLYHMMSTQGPCVSLADLNGDGLSDMVVPGPKGSPSAIYLREEDGQLQLKSPSTTLEKVKEAEHTSCAVFDADSDGDLDVYLASGGVELTKFSPLLYDKLLLNDGKGNLSATSQKLPDTKNGISTSIAVPADVDGDGDMDLFVGERVKIGQYGAPCSGYLLTNDGTGSFSDATATIAPALQDIGMISDATFADLDGDGTLELVVVGEFMAVTVLKQSGGQHKPVDGLGHLTGWWQDIKAVDVDNDGDLDLVLGNHGTNSRFQASTDRPLKLYFGDYDRNGTAEGIVTHTREDGKDYPYALRHTLQAQLPMLKKTFPDYKSYKTASMTEIFTEEQLGAAIVREAVEMRSLILENKGDLIFAVKALPASVQLSPMYAIAPADIDEDGDMDLFMGGNLHRVQPEVGRYDASYGHILINDGKGNYEDKAVEMGFSVKGEIRDIVVDGDVVHVFRNNDTALSYKFK